MPAGDRTESLPKWAGALGLTLWMLPVLGVTRANADRLVLQYPSGREETVVGVITDAARDESKQKSLWQREVICIQTSSTVFRCERMEYVVRIEEESAARNNEIRTAWEAAEHARDQATRRRLRSRLWMLGVLNGIAAIWTVLFVRSGWPMSQPEGQYAVPAADEQSSRRFDPVWIWVGLAFAACGTVIMGVPPAFPRTVPAWGEEWSIRMLSSVGELFAMSLFAWTVPFGTGLGYRVGERFRHPHMGGVAGLALSVPTAFVGFIYYVMSHTF